MAKEMVDLPKGQILYVGSHKYVGKAPKVIVDRIKAEEEAAQKRRSEKKPTAKKSSKE